MKKFFWVSLVFFISKFGFSQLERLVVEPYYVSDGNDGTDTIGGMLPMGAKTYRIYADLLPNTRVTKIFGAVDHPFVINSTSNFFNNKSQGQSFGKDFSKVFLSENTVALDSYLTIGQVAKQGSKIYFGLPKSQDSDGSFVGGVNNDGGSAMITAGLLANADSWAGIPLTTADGNDTMSISPITWTSYGIQDFVTQADSTIFGSIVQGNTFSSNDFFLQSSIGIDGVLPDSNFVLLAQLTTAGDLNFEMNIELEYWADTAWVVDQVMARDTLLSAGQSFNPFLSYPFQCGCTNDDYLEYSSAFVCSDSSACVTLAIIGCMDTLACNYNANANVSFEQLCCYPGWCGDRNIELVCPALSSNNIELSVYPNPSSTMVSCEISTNQQDDIVLEIYNSFGVKMMSQSWSNFSGYLVRNIDNNNWEPGLYYVLLKSVSEQKNIVLIKI